MFTRDHSRRRSGRPAAAEIDPCTIEAQITTATTAVRQVRFPATFCSSLRTAPKRLHEQFTPPSTTWSKVEKPHQQPPERLRGFHQGLSSAAPRKLTLSENVNQLTIDTISYILSQF